MSVRRSMPGSSLKETTGTGAPLHRHDDPCSAATADVRRKRNGNNESTCVGGEHGTKRDSSVRRASVQDAGAGKISDHDDDGIERRDGERQENCALPLCPKQSTEPATGIETGDDGMKRAGQELPEAQSHGGSPAL